MSKKNPGRRKNRIPINSDTIRIRIDTAGLVVNEIVTKAEQHGIEISESSIREALRVNKASPQVIRALSLTLEVSPFEFVADKDQHQEVLQPIHDELGTTERTRIYSGGRVRRANDPSQNVQDKKNVITDPRVSNSLIKMIGVPSLYKAVCSSAIFTPLDDAHKDTPYVPGMDYNHFLMIGAIVTLNWPGLDKPVAIAYHRSPGKLQYTYKHTKGLSVLWATGFDYPVGVTSDLDMQQWIDLATESPEQAEEAFMTGMNSTLVRLLSHKLKLSPYPLSIKKLGVVTNDQRKDKPRVYTQYVFQIMIDLDRIPRSVDSLLKVIVQEPDQPELFSLSRHASDQLINYEGQSILVDLAAWNLMHGIEAPNRSKCVTLGTLYILQREST